MLTAKEAKELYDRSGAEVNDYLERKIGPQIQKAAESGKRTVFHLIDCEETWKTIEMTPFQRQIHDKLTELGYHVRFGRDGDPYVPRGLADDDGNGPRHTNCGFTIGW